MMECARGGRRHLLPALVLLGFTALVYLPGLSGGFTFDDYHAIVENEALQLASCDGDALLDAALSAPATGPFARPLAMLSFAANRSLGGPDAWSFKLVNLLVHGVNAMLLFALLSRLLPRLAPRAPTGLAFVLAALWALHPLNLTSVLYVVQRMTSLSASGVLLAAWLYLDARLCRLDGGTPPRWWGLGVVLAGLAAVLVKETALCLPAYLLLIELLVRGRKGPPLPARAWAAIALACALALALGWGYFEAYLARGYAGREFTLAERLWTEPRVLIYYLQMIVLPLAANFSLFHDDLVVSSGPLSPPGTVLAVLVLAAVTLAVLWPRVRRAQPWWAFGWLWFLAGHALEGSVVPLEVMHEHRNYLPMFGILVMLGVPVAGVLRAPRLARAVAMLLCAAVALSTAQRAVLWRDPAIQVEADLAHHPASPRLWYEAGRLRMAQAGQDPGRQAAAIAALEQAARLAPHPALPFEALLKVAVQRQDAPAVARLVPVIAGHPRESVGVEVFQGLVLCQGYGRCRADADVTQTLAQALLQRPGLSARSRVRVLDWLAVWFARVLGDPAAGATILTDLVASRPGDLALATRLAELQAAAGQAGAARATAAQALAHLDWRSVVSTRVLHRRLSKVMRDTGEGV